MPPFLNSFSRALTDILWKKMLAVMPRKGTESFQVSKDQVHSYLVEMGFKTAGLAPISPLSSFGLLNKCSFPVPFGMARF